ncbi:antitoxin Xre/MbcA/ParS toxin-binding domain-containing protein [Cellulophaga sp. BC115SP]|uniref:type II RES/Xre toxin-antitoxin system antitoxin n=1 Tax=Cellulophaga sp. BC115SP TaxID=2683263 RepID=UPI001F0E89CC|nr:antitoxin Xre/MbcA/ParS toxin-binding domain-containing protein [Cellulophaga sp. BC115SP]
MKHLRNNLTTIDLFYLDNCPIFIDKCPKWKIMMTAIDKIEGKLDREIASFFKASKIDVHSKQNITYETFLEDKMLIIFAIRTGIPYSLFDLIQDYTPFSVNDWADVLDISTKSLQRYRTSPEHHFKPIHSEKIIEMAEVTKVGLDVFGNIEKLKLWLNTPSYALGNLKPIELLKDSYGKEMVINELNRINHGIFV